MKLNYHKTIIIIIIKVALVLVYWSDCTARLPFSKKCDHFIPNVNPLHSWDWQLAAEIDSAQTTVYLNGSYFWMMDIVLVLSHQIFSDLNVVRCLKNNMQSLWKRATHHLPILCAHGWNLTISRKYGRLLPIFCAPMRQILVSKIYGRLWKLKDSNSSSTILVRRLIIYGRP